MKAGMRAGNFAGDPDAQAIYVRIDRNEPTKRTVTWSPEHVAGVVHHIVLDGVDTFRTTAVTRDNFPQDIRASLLILETTDQNEDERLGKYGTKPGDFVTVTWDEVSGAARYQLFRKLGAGDYAAVSQFVAAGETDYTLPDGPLANGTYTWKIVAYDTAGNTTDSDEEVLVIGAPPGPPTDLAASMDGAALTLTWTEPEAGAPDHYAIHYGVTPNFVEITPDAVPQDTEATTSWTMDMTGLTDRYEFLVRSVSAGGTEEKNIRQMVAVEVADGAQVLIPNSPWIIQAAAAPAGEIDLVAVYDRTGESGVATTIRAYVNDGAGGAIDYDTPVGTATLTTGDTNQAVAITTSGLSGALTYWIGVRARTAAGVEDANTDYSEVTTDATGPAAPDITVTAA
ncbi:MAG TPA: hypothetical protein VMY35_01585 [Phycisphaerae bacterium]|nr:hypothetical protein [Phycisphaerae bacterium]